jgi:hypothetical protein
VASKTPITSKLTVVNFYYFIEPSGSIAAHLRTPKGRMFLARMSRSGPIRKPEISPLTKWLQGPKGECGSLSSVSITHAKDITFHFADHQAAFVFLTRCTAKRLLVPH